MKVAELHKGFRMGESNTDGNDCWGCGHWLIGGGCWKSTNPDDSCEEWVPEGTQGTITGVIAEHSSESM